MTETSVGEDRPLPDYYDVMHLHPAADAAMVDQVYWHLARLYNAAIATDREARAKLDALNQAYAVLRSPALREQYDEARGVAPGARSQTERKELPPPLTVMDTQRPRARDGSKTSSSRSERAGPRLWFSRLPGLGRIGQSVPSWQNAVSAAIIAALAAAALIARVEPLLIALLLIVGLSFTVIPLARKLPRLPALPRPGLPGLPKLRMPRLRLPQRAPKRSEHADILRQSTEAMLSRWRADAVSRAASEPDKPALSHDEGDDSAR